MTDYDVVVIGGGAGGLSAARTVKREGASVAMVVDGPIGGDCTFTGCVPSKTLLESAARGASFDEAMDAVRRVVASIAATETADVLRDDGIDVVEGQGRLTGGGGVDVDGVGLVARDIVVATGARPTLPPIPGLSELNVRTSDTLWELTERPSSLAVVGGGPIGCELAQAFAKLGVRVTLVEAAGRLLIREEPEVAPIIEAALDKAGVDTRTATLVSGAVQPGGQISLATDAGHIVADEVLVATGRAPSSQGLGLAEAGVDIDQRGYVVTDERQRTTAKHVWAVGDVTAKLPFTHAADEMGRIAGWNITRRVARYRFDPAWIPWVTFTDPEVAHVGVTEADAPPGSRVAELPLRHNDRARTADRTEGFVKLIVAPRAVLRNAGGGRVVGATIVAPRAGEMIHEPTLAIRTKMFAGRLAQTVHAYPTWSVAVQKAAAQLFYEIEGRTARPARRH